MFVPEAVEMVLKPVAVDVRVTWPVLMSNSLQLVTLPLRIKPNGPSFWTFV